MIQSGKPFRHLDTNWPECVNTSQISISHDRPLEQPDLLLSHHIPRRSHFGVGGQFHPQTVDPRDVQIHVPPPSHDLRQEEAVDEHDGDEVFVVFARFAEQFEIATV